MPRQASIRRSRPWPSSAGGSLTTNLGMAIRSCIWITPSQQNGPAARAPGVSWFTSKVLFLKENLRANVEYHRPCTCHPRRATGVVSSSCNLGVSSDNPNFVADICFKVWRLDFRSRHRSGKAKYACPPFKPTTGIGVSTSPALLCLPNASARLAAAIKPNWQA